MTEPDSSIDREFYSDYTNRPFEVCVNCDCRLQEPPRHYHVQKNIVAGETVFEMAICADCAMSMTMEYSDESREALAGFLQEKFDPDRFGEYVIEVQVEPGEDADEEAILVQLNGMQRRNPIGTGECVFCGRLRSECHRYSISDSFMGLSATGSLGPFAPCMICETCNSEISELISTKTRDLWDRFVEENFDGPPGIDIDEPKPEMLLV